MANAGKERLIEKARSRADLYYQFIVLRTECENLRGATNSIPDESIKRTPSFERQARQYSMDCLRNMIQHKEIEIENVKSAQCVEEYWAQNPEKRLEVETRIAVASNNIEKFVQATTEKFNTLLNLVMGEGWYATRLNASNLTIEVMLPNKDGELERVFGSDISIYHSDPILENEKPRFDFGIGSMGSFNPLTSTDASGRAFYYRGLGNLLNNRIALQQIQSMLTEFKQELYAKQEVYRKAADFLHNPFVNEGK